MDLVDTAWLREARRENTEAKVKTKTPRPENLSVVNFVCLSEILGEQLDLTQVAERTGGKYGKRVKQAVVIRSIQPKLTCMIMANGKMLICGGRSPDESLHLSWLVCLELQKQKLVKTDVAVSNFAVHNIVCRFDCQHKLNLSLFYLDHLDSSVYHPKKIKPVRHYMQNPKLVCVIFETGKCIITGATHQEQLHVAPSKIKWSNYKLGAEYRHCDPREFDEAKAKMPPGEKESKQKKNREEEEQDEIDQEMMEAMLVDEILCTVANCNNERDAGATVCLKHKAL